MNVQGVVAVPGDKSISHRALMFAALADGASQLGGLLASADIRSTAGALRALGVPIGDLDGSVRIDGVGLQGLRFSAASLDCGNSGTTTRMLSGILAGYPFSSRLVGDPSLSKRPMRRVADPLRAMGATIEFENGDGLPMTVAGGALQGLTWRSEVASAQVKSAILLAGLVAGVPVEVHEPAASRDHTERMLRARDIDVRVEGTVITFNPRGALAALDVDVPGDPSSATFLAVLAALAKAGSLALESICVNPTRIGAFRVLERMGAVLGYEDMREQGGESVATVVVTPRSLHGTVIEAAEVPSLIDELPVLACAAARAEGETRVTGAADLRAKESDRIATVVRNLCAIGAHATETSDGFVVQGGDHPLKGRVVTHGDHRIAMAFGVLGALDGNDIEIDDPACAGVSYPSFWSDLDSARA